MIKTVFTNINITGFGIIAPIGDNALNCYKSLINKQTGIGKIRYLQTVHKDEFPVGEVKHSNDELLALAGIDKRHYPLYTRASLLSAIAVKEAIHYSELSAENLKTTAFISATSVGGMDKTENCFQNPAYPSTDYIYTHPCGDVADKICELMGISGYRTTLSTACSSAANAIIHAALIIRSGRAHRVIAGGVDPLCKFTLNGFNSLMILDHEHCRPFDKNRKGLNLGEGAGFLVMESDESVKSRNATVFCKLTGYSNTNDAYHQTASSPTGDGAYLAMTSALDMAKLEPELIDYMNVHGTGTENNDLSEGIAIRRVFGENVPPFSSTKSLTGHALGAAAALEAVFSVMALFNKKIFPQINFTEPIEETGLVPVTEAIEKQLMHVLSNSFGFGGNNSTLIFSK